MAFCDLCRADSNKTVEIGTDTGDWLFCQTCAEDVHTAVEEDRTCLTCMYWTRGVCRKDFIPNDVKLPVGWACNQWDWADESGSVVVCGRDWDYTLTPDRMSGYWSATIFDLACGRILANDKDTLIERVRLHVEQCLLKAFDENRRGTDEE